MKYKKSMHSLSAIMANADKFCKYCHDFKCEHPNNHFCSISTCPLTIGEIYTMIDIKYLGEDFKND